MPTAPSQSPAPLEVDQIEEEVVREQIARGQFAEGNDHARRGQAGDFPRRGFVRGRWSLRRIVVWRRHDAIVDVRGSNAAVRPVLRRSLRQLYRHLGHECRRWRAVLIEEYGDLRSLPGRFRET